MLERMGASCTCGVSAIGRCSYCGDAFCISHAASGYRDVCFACARRPEELRARLQAQVLEAVSERMAEVWQAIDASGVSPPQIRKRTNWRKKGILRTTYGQTVEVVDTSAWPVACLFEADRGYSGTEWWVVGVSRDGSLERILKVLNPLPEDSPNGIELRFAPNASRLLDLFEWTILEAGVSLPVRRAPLNPVPRFRAGSTLYS